MIYPGYQIRGLPVFGAVRKGLKINDSVSGL
jgi:hypothetical protein